MTLSRRSLLTGLLSSAAVIAAGPVAKVIPRASAPCNVFDMGGTGGNTSLWHIKWGKETIFQMFPGPMHYASRIANIECPEGEPPDLFKMLERDVKTFVYGNPDWTPQPYQLVGLRALESGE